MANSPRPAGLPGPLGVAPLGVAQAGGRLAHARITAEMAEALAALLAGIERDDPADSIEGGITPAEALLEGEYTRALQTPLTALYRGPLADLARAYDVPPRQLPAWLLDWYRDHPALVAALAAVVARYGKRAFNLGGQVGLQALGLSQGVTFDISDPTILANIEAQIAQVADVDGQMSLVRTTANDLARQINANRDETSPTDLAPVLGAYAIARTVIRTAAIAMTESVRMSRWGMVTAFVGNGVQTVTHECQLDVYERCTSAACPGLWGQAWHLYSVFDPMGDIPGESRIPLHVGCRCWYKAETSGWLKPAIIWSGFALDAMADNW